jgi:hypothetical protein
MINCIKIFFLICFLFFNVNLSADRVSLKNGEIIIGKFLELTDEQIVIKTKDDTIKIPSTSVKDIEVGNENNDLCLEFQDGLKNCEVSLVEINKKLIYFYDNKLDDYSKKPIDEVKYFKLTPNKDWFPDFSDFQPITVQITTKDSNVIVGTLIHIKKGDINIRIGDVTRIIKSLNIKSLEYNENNFIENKEVANNNFNENKIFWDYLIPGSFQYKNQRKFMSSFLFSSTVIFSGIALYSFYSGYEELKNQNEINNFLFGTDATYAQYYKYKKMNNSSLLILGGIYTINILDILLYEKKDHINSQSIKFNIKSEQSQFINKESGVSLNFQFNMQF